MNDKKTKCAKKFRKNFIAKGYDINDLPKWRNIGGKSYKKNGKKNRHYNYLDLMLKTHSDFVLPEHENRCLCETAIKNNHYIEKDSNILVVGSCCINEFASTKLLRTCEICQVTHKTRKTNLCSVCKDIYCHKCMKRTSDYKCNLCDICYEVICKVCNQIKSMKDMDVNDICNNCIKDHCIKCYKKKKEDKYKKCYECNVKTMKYNHEICNLCEKEYSSVNKQTLCPECIKDHCIECYKKKKEDKFKKCYACNMNTPKHECEKCGKMCNANFAFCWNCK